MQKQNEHASGCVCPSCRGGRLFTRSTKIVGDHAIRYNRCPACDARFKHAIESDDVRRRHRL